MNSSSFQKVLDSTTPAQNNFPIIPKGQTSTHRNHGFNVSKETPEARFVPQPVTVIQLNKKETEQFNKEGKKQVEKKPQSCWRKLIK